MNRKPSLFIIQLSGRQECRPHDYLLNPSSSLISGRNSEITMPPMVKPRTTIMIGSSRLIKRLHERVDPSS